MVTDLQLSTVYARARVRGNRENPSPSVTLGARGPHEPPEDAHGYARGRGLT